MLIQYSVTDALVYYTGLRKDRIRKDDERERRREEVNKMIGDGALLR